MDGQSKDLSPKCERLFCDNKAEFHVHDKNGVYLDHNVCAADIDIYADRTRYEVKRLEKRG